MRAYTVKATFWEEGSATRRNKTKIIFNENEDKCIGIILMLNPGSCKPEKGEKIITEEKQVLVCKPDKTIMNVGECIMSAYNPQLQGYVYIVNLSNKRGTKPKELSEEDFRKSEDIISEINKKITEEPQIRWIWIAFGKDSNGKDKNTIKELIKIKENVKKQLNQMFPEKIFGEKVNYKHPYQRRKDEYKKYKQDIIEEIKKVSVY